MKAYKKIALALCVAVATSCTLDLREDPNAVQPNQVLPSLMLNSMQRNLAGLFNGASSTGMALTRQINAGSSLYSLTIRPEGFDGLWSNAYGNILEDADQLLKIAIPDKSKDNERYARHMGIARIIQAYCIILLVDSFGDVPFSQAFKGDGDFNPAPDDQAALYARAIQMLDSAKLDLTTPTTTSNPPGYHLAIAPDLFDMYYGAGPTTATTTFGKWIKLANTLKLKIYLNMRIEDNAAATTGINGLLGDASATGGLIGYTPAHVAMPLVQAAGYGGSENFVFRYATNAADPDSRHPRFAGQYPSGGGAYQSNWLMWHMFHGYDAVNTTTAGSAPGDPRMRFYFVRQTITNSTSTNEIRCLSESVPSHYPISTGLAIVPNSAAGIPPMGVGPAHPTNDPTDVAWDRTFCYMSDRGYWGRDHVDPQGIPPDNFLRTAYGPYPSGGRFDNNAGGGVGTTQGQRGAGIQPIMTRSFVNFMLSEARLYLALTPPGGLMARDYYILGLTQSFQDVRDWAVTGTYLTNSTAASAGEGAAIGTFYSAGNYSADVTAYITSATAAYDASLIISNDEAMNYIAREYWIALYGNGVESYNLYRRTGRPTGMQPTIIATPGSFPWSYWYPANFANLNSSVEQKGDLTEKVFWSTSITHNLNF